MKVVLINRGGKTLEESLNKLDRYLSIDILTNNMNYWFIRTNGGAWFEEFVHEEHCTIVDPNIELDKLRYLKSKNEIFKELDRLNDDKIEQINSESRKLNLKEEELKHRLQNETKSKRNMSNESNRLYNFIHNIKENDLVIIPSKSSRLYKIGIVASPAKQYTEDQIEEIEKRSFSEKKGKKRKKYHNSKNKIFRTVIWLKTIERRQINPKVLNHLNMHQTIANLNNFRPLLNQLISAIYIQHDKLHININVEREKGINNDLWSELHKTIGLVESQANYKIKEMKIDVQSPGLLEIILEIDYNTIESFLNGTISKFSPTGYLGATLLLTYIFNGKSISKFAGIEFVEKDSKKLKKMKEKVKIAEESVKHKRALVEEKELEKKLEALKTKDDNINDSLETDIKL